MECTINYERAKEFIESTKFSEFLLGNTTDFGTAAFILESCLKGLEDLQNPKTVMRAIPHQELVDLLEASYILEALNNGGVDDWTWYGESCKDFLDEQLPFYKDDMPEDTNFDFEYMAEKEAEDYPLAKI